jgi:hypothetical protein
VGERSIVLEGEIIGSSQSDVWTKWDALSAAFQSTLLSKGTLTITLPDGTTQRQTSVVLTGAAQPSFEGGSAYLQYQVNFRAPDPRWYGTTLNTSTATISTLSGTSTSASAVNAGNAPVSPTFTFGSSFDVAQIDVTVPTAYTSLSPQGSLISMTMGGLISVNSSSFINCATRTVSLVANGLASTTEWPVLYPGTTTWNQTSAGTAGVARNVVMSWRDAWW